MGNMDRDEGLPISVRLAMCLAEREGDPSGCRASGLTPERPRGAGSVAAGSAAFARCCGNENSVDFTRAGHRIVQSMFRPSFFFEAPEAYRRERLSDGHIAIKLKKTHFNSSRHNCYHVASWVHDIE